MTESLLILSFSPIASDARLLKQIAALKGRYRVTTLGYGPAPDGVERHIELPDDRVYWRYDRLAVVSRRYRRAYNTNPAVSFVRESVANGEFDIILANDIDTVGVALGLRPSLGVHADLHEYAPRQKDDMPRWRFFVAPFVRWMCRRFLPEVASITTVGEGIAREYRKRFGVEAEVVTNAAPFADLHPSDVHTPLRLVHSGACLRGRGIETIIDAVRATTTDVTVDLYLVPNDPSLLDRLRAVAASDSRVRVHDPVPYARLTETLNAYDVGIHILPPVNFNNAWALPNKFFDYLQARLGVIIGPSPEMASLVRERDLGTVTSDFTSDALRRVLDGLREAAVDEWKTASDTAAFDLSADAQVVVWQRALADMAATGGR